MVLGVGCAACSGGSEVAPAAAREVRAAPRYREATIPQLPLGADLRLQDLARALEAGERDEAARLVLGLDPSQGLDFHLLRARWLALEGDGVEAAREIEAAREAWPDQGRVYATAVELHAMAGRLETAAAELRAGLEGIGRTPELDRARGILALCSARSVPEGWKVLVALDAEHPSLPFLKRPLADAQLLMGRRALQQGDLEAVQACLAAGLAAWPGDHDLLELSADEAAARGDYDAAAATYEQFLAAGMDCAEHLATLHQRAATAALVVRDKASAVAHAARARALGLSNEELGFGVTILCEDAVQRGIAAYDGADYATACELFGQALELDPRNPETLDFRGKALFRAGRFAEAAVHFEHALDLLEPSPAPLPSPVHLNLARALVLCARGDEVPALLERYLEREPSGAFADETREMLARLVPPADSSD